jgi:hypothetical protein
MRYNTFKHINSRKLQHKQKWQYKNFCQGVLIAAMSVQPFISCWEMLSSLNTIYDGLTTKLKCVRYSETSCIFVYVLHEQMASNTKPHYYLQYGEHWNMNTDKT